VIIPPNTILLGLEVEVPRDFKSPPPNSRCGGRGGWYDVVDVADKKTLAWVRCNGCGDCR